MEDACITIAMIAFTGMAVCASLLCAAATLHIVVAIIAELKDM